MSFVHLLINVDEESEHAGKSSVLYGRLDVNVRKEESHGAQGTDGHGVLSTEKLGVAHEAGQDRTRNTADVGQAVVAPSIKRRTVEFEPVGLQVSTKGRVSRSFI
jgi:hypothetical protein